MELDKKVIVAFHIDRYYTTCYIGVKSVDKILNVEKFEDFSNDSVLIHNIKYWDVFRIFYKIKEILNKISKQYIIESIGVSGTTKNFALLDKNNNILRVPLVWDKLDDEISDKNYELSGNKFAYSCELFEFLSFDNSGFVEIFEKILFIPDLINYFLTSKLYNNLSFVSTSQFFDNINKKIIKFNSKNIFYDIIKPSEVIGFLTSDIKKCLNIDYDVKVVSVCADDISSIMKYLYKNCKKFSVIKLGDVDKIFINSNRAVITKLSYKNSVNNEWVFDNKYALFKVVEASKYIRMFKKIMKKRNIVIDMNFEITDYSNKLKSFEFDIKEDEDIVKAFTKLLERSSIKPTVDNVLREVYLFIAHLYREYIFDLQNVSGIDVDDVYIFSHDIEEANLLKNIFSNIIVGKNISIIDENVEIIGNMYCQI